MLTAGWSASLKDVPALWRGIKDNNAIKCLVLRCNIYYAFANEISYLSPLQYHTTRNMSTDLIRYVVLHALWRSSCNLKQIICGGKVRYWQLLRMLCLRCFNLVPRACVFVRSEVLLPRPKYVWWMASNQGQHFSRQDLLVVNAREVIRGALRHLDSGVCINVDYARYRLEWLIAVITRFGQSFEKKAVSVHY